MYVIHLFAQQLPILEAWLGYVTVCRILMAWKMRGIKAGYKVMQPLMASRGDKSGADQQKRPHHGFESLRGWRSYSAITANAPPISAGCMVFREGLFPSRGCAPMVTAVALQCSWRQTPFTLGRNQSGGPVQAPADRLGAFGTGLGQGFGGSLVASPKPYAHFSAALTIEGSRRKHTDRHLE